MSGATETSTLDRILALQLTVAWAGEGLTEPRRLGWWRTAFVDELGGEDLFRRLTPRTWQWAVLEGAREAARRTDAEARAQASDADAVVSLFHLGVELDEQLDDRLAELKRSGREPRTALAELGELTGRWNRDAFAAFVTELGPVNVAPSTIGRRLKGEAPADPIALARSLTAALAPLEDRYPAPHYATARGASKAGRT